MNANELLATELENAEEVIDKLSAMLRKQAEAIRQLREALKEIADDAIDPYSDAWAGTIAKNALAATEAMK